MYGLPELQMPNMVNAYTTGRELGYQQSERVRKAPLVAQLEQLELQKSQQGVESSKKAITLQDLSMKEKQDKARKEEMEDIAKAANWVLQQPQEMQEQAFNRTLDFYAQEGKDVESLRGRMDLLPMLAQVHQPQEKGGLASATTTTWKNGTTLFNLPNGAQRLVFQGREITSPEEIKTVIENANKSGLALAGEEAKARETGKLTATGEMAPQIEKDKNYSAGLGRLQAEDQDKISYLIAAAPELRDMTDRLSALSDEASYTGAGILKDSIVRQLGLDPGSGAVAREEIVTTVSNEILPLLRQTFGAQFTEREGDKLIATLGDPKKSPKERKAAMNSFNTAKERELRILSRKHGIDISGQVAESERMFLEDKKRREGQTGMGATNPQPAQSGKVIKFDPQGNMIE